MVEKHICSFISQKVSPEVEGSDPSTTSLEEGADCIIVEL